MSVWYTVAFIDLLFFSFTFIVHSQFSLSYYTTRVLKILIYFLTLSQDVRLTNTIIKQHLILLLCTVIKK